MGPVTEPLQPSPGMLERADRALVRTVDGLADPAYAGASLLPGWSRAHVVAHVALNAEGLAGVLHGAHLGRPAPMYASAAARDRDIAELAAAEPAELRERLLRATTLFSDALAAMRHDDWSGRFERTPGGPELALASVPLMRVREVEIHHADLDAGHTHADWPADFSGLLLESMTRRHYPTPFSARPDDLDRTWRYGEGAGGPVVTGTPAALGWWLTGRGSGAGLTSDAGSLPEVEPW